MRKITFKNTAISTAVAALAVAIVVVVAAVGIFYVGFNFQTTQNNSNSSSNMQQSSSIVTGESNSQSPSAASSASMTTKSRSETTPITDITSLFSILTINNTADLLGNFSQMEFTIASQDGNNRSSLTYSYAESGTYMINNTLTTRVDYSVKNNTYSSLENATTTSTSKDTSASLYFDNNWNVTMSTMNGYNYTGAFAQMFGTLYFLSFFLFFSSGYLMTSISQLSHPDLETVSTQTFGNLTMQVTAYNYSNTFFANETMHELDLSVGHVPNTNLSMMTHMFSTYADSLGTHSSMLRLDSATITSNSGRQASSTSTLSKTTSSTSTVASTTSTTQTLTSSAISTQSGESHPRDSVTILSSTMYTDSLGLTHVVGEVQNTGTNNLDFVEITVTFYNNANAVLDTTFTYASMDILVPNQKSPFDAILFNNLGGIDHYKVVVTDAGVTSVQPNQNLSVQGVTNHVDSIGYLHIVGEVTNRANLVSNSTQIVVTFYDSGGKVVESTFAFTSPIDLRPGETGSFDAFTSQNVAQISYYMVQVQCYVPSASTSVTYSSSTTGGTSSATVATTYTISQTETSTTSTSTSQSQSKQLPPRDSVVVQSSTLYTDSAGYSHVVGEVKNTGTRNLNYVMMTVTFYDSSDKTLTTSMVSPYMDILVPNQTSPFSTFPFHSNSLIDHYTVVVSGASVTSAQPNQNLNLQVATAGSDVYGIYHVVGAVQNMGSVMANYTMVAVTLYDSSGRVIAATSALTLPINLKSGEIGSFDASAIIYDSQVASYSIQVQCEVPYA